MTGFTRDISDTGMAIVVASNPFGRRGPGTVGRKVRLMIDLPTGVVQIHATVVRCQPLGEKGKEKESLIGVQITEMNNYDWVNMVRYIHTLH